ncbi:MAG: DUF1307 domain-containing protein, partial [Clostridia bacterium]|nr:DUF1307 domain-containing protein [Clostridia bacterium]
MSRYTKKETKYTAPEREESPPEAPQRKKRPLLMIFTLLCLCITAFLVYLVTNMEKAPTGESVFLHTDENGMTTEIHILYAEDTVYKMEYIYGIPVPEGASDEDIDNYINDRRKERTGYSSLPFCTVEHKYEGGRILERVVLNNINQEENYKSLVRAGIIRHDKERSSTVSFTSTKETLLSEGYKLTYC